MWLMPNRRRSASSAASSAATRSTGSSLIKPRSGRASAATTRPPATTASPPPMRPTSLAARAIAAASRPTTSRLWLSWAEARGEGPLRAGRGRAPRRRLRDEASRATTAARTSDGSQRGSPAAKRAASGGTGTRSRPVTLVSCSRRRRRGRRRRAGAAAGTAEVGLRKGARHARRSTAATAGGSAAGSTGQYAPAAGDELAADVDLVGRKRGRALHHQKIGAKARSDRPLVAQAQVAGRPEVARGQRLDRRRGPAADRLDHHARQVTLAQQRRLGVVGHQQDRAAVGSEPRPRPSCLA